MSFCAKFVTDSCLAITLQKLLWVCFSAGSDQINFLTGQGVTSSQFANHQMLWTSHPYVFVRKRSRSRPWPRPVNYELKKERIFRLILFLSSFHTCPLSHIRTHTFTPTFWESCLTVCLMIIDEVSGRRWETLSHPRSTREKRLISISLSLIFTSSKATKTREKRAESFYYRAALMFIHFILVLL